MVACLAFARALSLSLSLYLSLLFSLAYTTAPLPQFPVYGFGGLRTQTVGDLLCSPGILQNDKRKPELVGTLHKRGYNPSTDEHCFVPRLCILRKNKLYWFVDDDADAPRGLVLLDTASRVSVVEQPTPPSGKDADVVAAAAEHKRRCIEAGVDNAPTTFVLRVEASGVANFFCAPDATTCERWRKVG